MPNLALVSSLIGLLLAAPTTVASAAITPSDRITVEVVTVNGSGCPAGTATVSANPDNTSFSVTYTDFVAEAGGTASPTGFRKNCQLSLRISVPRGRASGTELAAYYFQGSSETTSMSHQFDGPYSRTRQAVDTTDVAELVFAPCGVQRNFNINSELRVDAGTSDPAVTNAMTMGSTRGSLQTLYSLSWRSCA
jgi:hypothetical protein